MVFSNLKKTFLRALVFAFVTTAWELGLKDMILSHDVSPRMMFLAYFLLFIIGYIVARWIVR